MINYKLLTPGPLTTSSTVKSEMLVDHCTWDDDYKRITQDIRKRILKLAHASEETYTVVLMQGSGTFGVESVFTSVIGNEDKVLICANGEYGNRMEKICTYSGIHYICYKEDLKKVPDPDVIEGMLKDHPEITHIAMVHSETTSGIINDIQSVSHLAEKYGKSFIVDGMSSFGGIDIPVEKLGIDFLITSSNKCIQGVPGFSIIICNRKALEESKGKARSLSLDLYDQWKCMEKDGKWRFTSPTHVVLAFDRALTELEAEGGIEKRHERYVKNNRRLISRMKDLGFQTYIDEEVQGPIITTFLCPENGRFDFGEFYDYIKERGYAIYPGKVTDADTFRVGNIGEIYLDDMNRLTDIIEKYKIDIMGER